MQKAVRKKDFKVIEHAAPGGEVHVAVAVEIGCGDGNGITGRVSNCRIDGRSKLDGRTRPNTKPSQPGSEGRYERSTEARFGEYEVITIHQLRPGREVEFSTEPQ